MSTGDRRPEGLDSLGPFESGQWAGFEGPALIRPGHETRLAVIGAAMALVGFCLPLVGVRYTGSVEATLFTGPQLLLLDPRLWLVPALASLALLIAMREPERRGRALVGLLALAAVVPLVNGLLPGLSCDSPTGISDRGFYGTLGHLKGRRDAAYQRVKEAWEKDQKKGDKKGLEDIDVGDLGDLDDEEEKPKKKKKKEAPRPPARPAEPTITAQGHSLSIGFYLLLLGLAMSCMSSWPWTEAALAWLERILLVLLLLAMLVLAGVPVVAELDTSKRLHERLGDTAWMVRLSRMSVVWVALIGASLATRERGHIAIEVLERFAPKKVCTWLKLISAVFAVVVLLHLVAASAEYVQLSRAGMLARLLDTQTPAPPFYVEVKRWGIALHRWVFTLIFPIGLFFLTLRFALLGGQDLLGVKFDHYYGEPR